MKNKLKNEIKNLKTQFAKVYTNEIKPQLLENEQIRKQLLKKVILTDTLLIVLSAIFTGLGLSRFAATGVLSNLVKFYFVAAIVSIVIGILYSYFENQTFSDTLKKQYKKKIIKGFKEIVEMHWIKKPTINKTELEMSGLFASFDYLDTDDCFRGTYKDIEYAIQECTLTQNESAFWLAFKGIVVQFSSNKRFKGNTLISTKNDFNIKNIDLGTLIVSIIFLGLGIYLTWIIFSYIYGQMTVYGEFNSTELLVGLELLVIPVTAIGCLIWVYHKKLSLKKTKLEDIDFEKKYKVQTTDEIEARYLLTPSFMERLKNIQTAFETSNIKCAFSSDSLMLAIPTNKNIFEIGNLLTPLDNAQTFDRFFTELTSLLILIEHFKLEEKTGL